MAIKYVPYTPNTLQGQAILDNFVRTRRILYYNDNRKVLKNIQRGMPLYETELRERVGKNADGNLVIRGECLSACAYLKENNIKVDLVYIDPPFASGADYAKKVYLRRNPKIQKAIKLAEEKLKSKGEFTDVAAEQLPDYGNKAKIDVSALEIEDLRVFEEKMYGDIWNKESYLNWMYENLMGIKSVMSDTASIYVHLDWHIGHYVKILLDEIFGEENFQREIIWDIQVLSGFKTIAPNWVRGHDTIFYYSKSENRVFNKLIQPHKKDYLDSFNRIDENGRHYMVAHGTIRYRDEVEKKGKPFGDVWNDIMSFQQQPTSDEKVDYATQKPTSLLERIIKASSNEGMVVADFFGGRGVTATVACKLNRNFIHVDINTNSIQTTRDRLKAINAEFDILEVKDGVSLYRNPVQTMDKLKKLIHGLRNEDALDKFWEGSIIDTKYGMSPVYIPNLIDGTTRVLDKSLMNRIITEAMPDLPPDTKRVIVYYIDIDDREGIEQFIRERNDTLIKIELRDLKQVLDDVVADDYAEWNLSEEQTELIKEWKVEILQFQSDRIKRKIDELNQKNEQQVLHGGSKKLARIQLSEEGLEAIEWVSLDCTSAEKNAPWHSDAEIKIDKLGYAIINSKKTSEYWDACIRSMQKPLRMKIRNICGDETVFCL